MFSLVTRSLTTLWSSPNALLTFVLCSTKQVLSAWFRLFCLFLNVSVLKFFYERIWNYGSLKCIGVKVSLLQFRTQQKSFAVCCLFAWLKCFSVPYNMVRNSEEAAPVPCLVWKLCRDGISKTCNFDKPSTSLVRSLQRNSDKLINVYHDPHYNFRVF